MNHCHNCLPPSQTLEEARLDTITTASAWKTGNGNGMGQAEIGRHAMWQNITCGRVRSVRYAQQVAYSVHAVISAVSKLDLSVQGLAERWALGCVNPTSWLSLASWREFTQPRAHLLANPCT